jgi:predicted Zn-ribbon and HTH transcriptional regulator|tara:strand:+ start:261 stop:452 length:192 start_codon:yes stop_codon:yes gene_type:complete
MSKIEFKEKFGPGKCSKCGVYIEDDVRMFVATNLAGRPSLTKDQLLVVDPEFCENCHTKVLGN